VISENPVVKLEHGDGAHRGVDEAIRLHRAYRIQVEQSLKAVRQAGSSFLFPEMQSAPPLEKLPSAKEWMS